MNVRLQYPMTFTAGIFYNSELTMNNYNIRLWLTTNSLDHNEHNIAYERMRYFVQKTLDSSVFIYSEDSERCQLLAKSGVRITTLPADPVDQIIGMMLYSKLNAIMEQRMILHEVEVSSELGDGMIYMHGADENIGPLEEPGWWAEADLTHYDNALVDHDKVMTLNRSAAWRELGLAWPDSAENTDTGNTIVFADFNRNDTE